MSVRKYLNEGNFGLLFGTVLFIYFFYIGLTRDRINSEHDLVKIAGTYLSHSFEDNTGFRGRGHEYYLSTEEHTNVFQVKADYLGIFDKKEFLASVKSGDDVIFTIPKASENRLNSEDIVFVTSIESNGQTFLNINEALESERKASNSNSDYFLGIIHLLIGLAVFVRERLRRTNIVAV